MTSTVAVAGLNQESNAFSRDRSSRDDFIEVAPEKMERAFGRTSTEIAGFFDVVSEAGFRIAPAGFAFAETGGLLDRSSALDLVTEFADRIVATEPDVVLLALHGSMAAEGIDDIEGQLLDRLRRQLGADPVIARTLDWHCSITPAMNRHADLLVAYRTYPHIDQRERAIVAADLALRAHAGEVRPISASAHPPLIVAGPTSSHLRSPMREILATATQLAGEHRNVLDWSICPGYARSDVPDAGVHTHVVTGDDPDLAEDLTRQLGRLMWDQRQSFSPELVDLDSAVRASLEPRTGPLVLSDQGDNPGGGATGRSVMLLEALLEADVSGVVVCSLYDPEAIDRAAAVATPCSHRPTPASDETSGRPPRSTSIRPEWWSPAPGPERGPRTARHGRGRAHLERLPFRRIDRPVFPLDPAAGWPLEQ